MANNADNASFARRCLPLLPLLLFALPMAAMAQQAGLPALTSTPAPGGGQTYSLSLQTLLLLTGLSFLPAVLLMMTSFTRIIVVLSLLRQALGTQSAPPNQVIIGLALFLTLFVMSPVLDKIYTEAYQPFSENKIQMQEALDKAVVPLKAFMLKQTRGSDLALYVKMSNAPAMSPPTPASTLRTSKAAPTMRCCSGRSIPTKAPARSAPN